MSINFKKKPTLVKNNIAKQSRQNARGFTVAEWNNIINILRQQTNLNTSYLEQLHRILFTDYDTNSTGFIETLLNADPGILNDMLEFLANGGSTIKPEWDNIVNKPQYYPVDPDDLTIDPNDIIDDTSNNTLTKSWSANKIYTEIDAILTLLQSDDVDYDTLQELVNFIKANDTSITNHMNSQPEHRIINDEGSSLTDLLSAAKIKELLDALPKTTISLTKPEGMKAGDVWLKDLSDPTKQYAFIKVDNIVGTITLPTYTLPNLGLIENISTLSIPEWVESMNESFSVSNLVGTITVPTYTLPNLGLIDNITQQQFI